MSENATKLSGRIVGGIVGGVGTYVALQLFNGWGLSEPVMWALAAGMTVVGFMFGVKIWNVVTHFV